MSRHQPEMTASAFTLVEILIVLAVIGLLLTVVIPNYTRARTATQRRICIKNLQEIDGAKQQWAIENRRIDGARVRAADIQPYLSGQRMPTCPAKGKYFVRSIGQDPTCTLDFLGHSVTNLSQ